MGQRMLFLNASMMMIIITIVNALDDGQNH